MEIALGRDAIRDLAESRVALEDCALLFIVGALAFLQDARAYIAYLEPRARPCMTFADHRAWRRSPEVATQPEVEDF